MVKEHLSNIQNGKCSKIELILTGICLILSGIVIGMKFAPARIVTLGSFNGNSGSIDKPAHISEEQ